MDMDQSRERVPECRDPRHCMKEKQRATKTRKATKIVQQTRIEGGGSS